MTRTVLKLTIPQKLADEPVVQHLLRDFELVAVIHKGKFTEKGAAITVELEGKAKEIEAALDYLSQAGVQAEAIG